jgi:hypothetical protein
MWRFFCVFRDFFVNLQAFCGFREAEIGRSGTQNGACFILIQGVSELKPELTLRIGFCNQKKIFIFIKKNYHFSQ